MFKSTYALYIKLFQHTGNKIAKIVKWIRLCLMLKIKLIYY